MFQYMILYVEHLTPLESAPLHEYTWHYPRASWQLCQLPPCLLQQVPTEPLLHQQLLQQPSPSPLCNATPLTLMSDVSPWLKLAKPLNFHLFARRS